MTKEEIGEIIKKTRLSTGLTQLQVAKKLQRPQQTIANWEVGRSQPDANTLFELFQLLGTDLNEAFGFAKKQEAFFSSEEIDHIMKLRVLDEHGKKAVNAILNIEYENCQSTQEEADNIIQFHVPEYWQTVSSGTGDWNDDDSWKDLLLTKQPPKGSAYVVRISGDSMEPTFQHGDRLFICPQDTLEDGQIGIFVMDSCMYVKELRKGRLISHNPEYEPIVLNESARCQGRVLDICDESYFE